MNSSITNKCLMILVASFVTFSTAEDKPVELPKYSNVISILIGNNHVVADSKSVSKESEKQTTTKVSK